MSKPNMEFRVLCEMFEAMQRNKSPAKKRIKFRKFLDTYCISEEYFSAIRLILPTNDRERGTYGLKESSLAISLIEALGISKDSEDAQRLINWRKGGAKTGFNVGNFALVAAEVLERRQGKDSGGLTIKELNDLLDQLASSENRPGKASVLADLIKKTNAKEMKWIVMIILKDLKLGVSEKTIFQEFHPDAEDLFNVTCDLKLVCEKLKDRTQRHRRQDIEVGKVVRPQLAKRVSDAATAWKQLHGKQVVVECKFDGDRIQIHKNGAEIHFFSRNFIDHPEYGSGMSKIILQNILVDRCILDGEMLVWDTSTNRFAEFGSNQEIAKAVKEGLEGHRQLCYVAFDILYVGDTSVIHQSLKERHDLLRKYVNPLKGSLEILVPNGGLNSHCPLGEPCWSLIAYDIEDVKRFFKETIENRDEGIVLKDLGSKWEPGDRSGKWLKLKPDYIHAGSDLDVLIIGGYFGSGRRGGEVAQFLMGLAERSTPDTYPNRFISFCRVGTGLSDEELDVIITKLKPYFRKNEYPKKKAPSFYEVTNNSKERPDVWIDSPEKSIILSITSDIRTIKSTVFGAPYSLRFPRIDRVRYDKPWHECLDVQSFVDLVHSSNGNTQRETDHGSLQDHKSKRTKKGEKSTSVVPAHFIRTDVSGIKETTYIFTNMMFYFVNVPPSYSVDSLHKMVVENGGTFSMNLNDSVTHCIAAERKGIKYQAAMLRGDVIHYSWILDCCSQKRLLHLQPKYFLFLGDSSKNKLQEEIDEFSDYYYCDLDIRDLKQLFSNMDGFAYPKGIEYYKKKYCAMENLCLLQGCCIYFHHSIHSADMDSKFLLELSLRRIKLEVSMHGGVISNILSCATHLVAFSVTELNVDFDTICKSFPAVHRHLLSSKELHVVRHQWLEDSLEKGKRLQVDAYSLKPENIGESSIEQSGQEVLEAPATLNNVEKQKFSSFPDRPERQSRGRPVRTNAKRGRTGFQRARMTRSRLGNKPAKIDQNESDNSVSSDEIHGMENVELQRESLNVRGTEMNEKDGSKDTNRPGDAKMKVTKQKCSRDDEHQEGSSRVDEIKSEKKIGTQDERKADGTVNLTNTEEEKKGTSQKVELMVDPVQAMLLDMIPSLGVKKAESEKPVVEDEKSQVDPDANPAKKKKISYKDVAAELLKDW
ncbi:DNA ligase IV [Tasmannia lanceolata]|uniref:DNA ligase IV n=1 Tax=Tasmannia lanceolata TaxID=3420 RepID=UPI0040643405